MRRFFAVTLFHVLLSHFLFAQTKLCTFNPEENLKYSLYYSLGIVSIPAGEILFSSSKRTFNNHPVFFIEVSGRSLKSYELFYSMHENIRTYAEPETLNPIMCELKMVQKGKEYFENIRFEGVRKKIYIENKDDNKPFKIDSCQMKNNTFDFLTAFYYIRSHNLSTSKYGEVIPVKIISGTEIHSINVKIMCRENLCLPESGNIKALKVAVGTIPGDIFKKGDEIIIWLSDDDKHIPLQFESKVLIGSVKAIILSNLEFSN